MDQRQRFKWFLGIDVSKETFDASCIPSQGERLFNLSASMDRKGFEELVKQLSSLSIPQECVVVGMESTACYDLSISWHTLALEFYKNTVFFFIKYNLQCISSLNPLR